MVVGLGTFGLGETLWAPVAPALVTDLAPEELPGRHHALQGMSLVNLRRHLTAAQDRVAAVEVELAA